MLSVHTHELSNSRIVSPHRRVLVEKLPNRGTTVVLLYACIVVLVLGCQSGGNALYSGNTMGTYYRISAVCSSLPTRALVEEELRKVDEVMSNYRPDSHVALFNSFPVGKWFDAPRSLVHVVAVANQVSVMSTGKFDITVEPLVSAWGFGASEVKSHPTSESVLTLLDTVDYRKLEYRAEPPGLRKLSPLTIDLSGIAKGYGVDKIAELLDEHECDSYLVDIGGEIRVRGSNLLGKAWQIGIEMPDGSGRVHSKVSLTRGAVATTGDYRNVREIDGQTFAHLLDPATGMPVNSTLASVTVFMPTAIEADALATGLFVLGGEAYGVAARNEIAAIFLTWNESQRSYSMDITPAVDEFTDTNSIDLGNSND